MEEETTLTSQKPKQKNESGDKTRVKEKEKKGGKQNIQENMSRTGNMSNLSNVKRIVKKNKQVKVELSEQQIIG